MTDALDPARLIHLLDRLSLAATEAESARDVLAVALDEVCAATGWPMGHAYVREEPGWTLVSSCVWHFDDPEAAEGFRRATEDTTFEPGEGLPGRVVSSGEPSWIADISEDDNFPRMGYARTMGIRSAFAFPVRTRRGVAAVLEFYSVRKAEPDEALLTMLATVGSLLGRVFERVEATRSLREREARFRAVAENAADAIVTIDGSSTILFANPAMGEVLGYDPDDLVGKPFTDLMPERFRERHRTGLGRYVRTGRKRLDWSGIELVGLHRSGAEVPLEVTFGEFVRDGRYFFTGIMRDVSDRKRVEEERERMRESRRRLLRGFTHDILNPLGAADGYLANLEEILDDLSEVQRSHVRGARRSLGSALELIENLMELVRAEAGHLVLTWEAVDPVAVAREVADDHRFSAEEKGIELSVRAPTDTPTLRSDVKRVRQVLGNLVSNAVKYTPEGGRIVVSVSAPDRPSDGAAPASPPPSGGSAPSADAALSPNPARRAEDVPSADETSGDPVPEDDAPPASSPMTASASKRKSPRRLEITVSDSGPGIPREKRHLLFEEFARLQPEQTGGTGIGLAISRQIAQAMGGGLFLDDRSDQSGAAFTFWLPLSGPESFNGAGPRP